MSDQNDIVLNELQNTIGQLYTQLAKMKAEAVVEITARDEEIKHLNIIIDELKSKIDEQEVKK